MEEDFKRRSSKAVFLTLTIPAMIAWAIITLEFCGIYRINGWARSCVSIAFAAVSICVLLSLDRLDSAIKEAFPNISPKKKAWVFHGLFWLNLPLILLIFNSVSQ